MNQAAILLVVDDQAGNRETLRELLAPQNYRIMEAVDGPAGLRLAAETPPDLVLLDVMMPGMDGYEVCRRLRADALLADVPVIMLTALDDQASRVAGIEAGADDFVTKPFNRAELRARVHTITRLNRYRRLLETQAQLHDSEARFRQLAEHSNEGFWFVSLMPRQFNYVSPGLEKISGRPAARFYEDPLAWEKIIHPDDQARVQAAFATVLAGASLQFAEEYRVIQPDTTLRWVLDSGAPVRNAAGSVVSIGGVARDITERKEAEGLMLRAQRLENIGMLAAGIAHDFNNALAPILMAGPLLQSHVSDPGGQRLLATVEKSAERGAKLVRQLLSFARGASDESKLLQIRHVLREVIELAEVTFPKSIQIESHLPDDLWPVQANPTQLHQIFLNLCVNARDAMPRGGELILTAANRTLDAAAAAEIAGGQPGAFLAVEVRDTGTGIPPEVLARIWDPFFTTKGEGKGTGLGLSTVHGIAHNHRGFVTVQTQAGQGTAFTVYLPAEIALGNGEPDAPGAQLPRGAGELILVVDDEQPVRELVSSMLTRFGYRTLTARDGAEAIAVFVPHAADVQLLLTDSDMPMLGGPELTAALHRLKPGLPVVCMSGAQKKSSAQQKEFTKVYLPKPFQVATLLSVVRQALDEASPPVSTPPAPSLPAT